MNIVPLNPPVKLTTYSVRVDGHERERIDLQPMTQCQRDEIRRELAKEYQIPTHYIRLCPVMRVARAAR
ncbi:MAG: hypothetical protein GC149_20480 [Gammaproteobacteria bacterium]|nr:hypothetical protein [Gammaproteobacteria bacterium]